MIRVIYADVVQGLQEIEDKSVQSIVTSPPYWALRDYGYKEQIGLEETVEAYVEKIADVMDLAGRKLRDDGTLFLNLADSYFGDSAPRKSAKERFGATWDKSLTRSNGGTRRSAKRQGALRSKTLCLIPARVAISLQERGWILRGKMVWAKFPYNSDTARDRPSRTYEEILLLTKRPKKYLYNQPAQDRDVWFFAPPSNPPGHPATFPEELPRRCIMAGSNPGDTILDPFAGSGTTLAVAESMGRNSIGIELNESYRPIIEAKIRSITPPLDFAV